MIQSVLFDINKWSIIEAVKWLITHGLRHNKVDIKAANLRFRQFPPNKNYRYFTKKLNNGIKLIIKI